MEDFCCKMVNSLNLQGGLLGCSPAKSRSIGLVPAAGSDRPCGLMESASRVARWTNVPSWNAPRRACCL